MLAIHGDSCSCPPQRGLSGPLSCAVLARLHPQIHTKERVLQRLVLEHFLSALLAEIQAWVREQGPKTRWRA